MKTNTYFTFFYFINARKLTGNKIISFEQGSKLRAVKNSELK